MLTINVRRMGSLLLLLGCVGGAACKGKGNPSATGSANSGGSGADGATGTAAVGAGGASASSAGAGAGMSSSNSTGTSTGEGGSMIDAGGTTVPPTPFDAKTAAMAARKVKNLLVGLAPTDADVAKLTSEGAAGLQELIATWMTDPTFQPSFRAKMIFFLRNTFQQSGFSPTEDFKPQLLENGGFDFGPFGTSAVGDDAFARLVQNLQDSFALTAWAIIDEGRPFTDTLTTQRYMMTTGLKSLYLQIEMPNDQPYSFNQKNPIKWKVDYSGNAIPLTDTLNPNSANYMTFDDQAPTVGGTNFGGSFPTCRGGTVMSNGAPVTVGQYTGYAQLFQRLIGYTPRYPFAATPTCWEHASKPYFTTQDLSDWQWVNVRPLKSGEAYVQPYDLPTLRKATELAVALPRVGFYTTPAFLAMWNTNDSNQHRVTADQALLVALGESFDSESTIVPLSEAGLDPNHSVTGTECYGCHKSLDPMRQFWANQYDFNDRNDFITKSFTGAAPNPRPTSIGGVFAFSNVNMSGSSILDFGPLVMQVNDGSQKPLNQFAVAITQKLCYYANSAPCATDDPEFARVVTAFQKDFNFSALIKELFASPLVTGAVATQTFDVNAVPVSVSRRDHFCAALSNRLAKPDLCSLAVPLPSTAQAATARIGSSIAADAFSRGAEAPVTPSTPTLFYRAAVEMLCENLAPAVVDATSGTVYTSANKDMAITDMVEKIMGYPPSDPDHDQAVTILQNHYSNVVAQKGTATNALRSTFVLACESPTAVSMGL